MTNFFGRKSPTMKFLMMHSKRFFFAVGLQFFNKNGPRNTLGYCVFVYLNTLRCRVLDFFGILRGSTQFRKGSEFLDQIPKYIFDYLNSFCTFNFLNLYKTKIFREKDIFLEKGQYGHKKNSECTLILKSKKKFIEKFFVF